MDTHTVIENMVQKGLRDAKRDALRESRTALWDAHVDALYKQKQSEGSEEVKRNGSDSMV